MAYESVARFARKFALVPAMLAFGGLASANTVPLSGISGQIIEDLNGVFEAGTSFSDAGQINVSGFDGIFDITSAADQITMQFTSNYTFTGDAQVAFQFFGHPNIFTNLISGNVGNPESGSGGADGFAGIEFASGQSFLTGDQIVFNMSDVTLTPEPQTWIGLALALPALILTARRRAAQSPRQS